MMIARLLMFSASLKGWYEAFYDLVDTFRDKNQSLFFESLEQLLESLVEDFRKKRKVHILNDWKAYPTVSNHLRTSEYEFI